MLRSGGGCSVWWSVETAFAGDLVVESAAGPLASSATEATVVFFRPSSMATAIRPVVVDEAGHVVGQLRPGGYFATTVPAGEHTFVLWGEGTPTLRATVEAGEIYYVKIDVSAGFWVARFPMVAMGPGREAWGEVPGWLEHSKRWDVVPAETAAYATERADDVRVVLQKSEHVWERYDEERRRNRTLTPDDGVTTAPGG